jgi:hypothetical protein
MLALAQRALSLGEVHKAELVAPDYVQHEISWKKLSEQGGLK